MKDPMKGKFIAGEEILRKKLYEFINSNQASTWIETYVAQVFVRKSKRLYDTIFYDCLDIASITVKANYRGLGVFTRFLDYAESINPYEILLAESVIGGQQLINFFDHRQHYIRYPDGGCNELCPSFLYIGK